MSASADKYAASSSSAPAASLAAASSPAASSASSSSSSSSAHPVFDAATVGAIIDKLSAKSAEWANKPLQERLRYLLQMRDILDNEQWYNGFRDAGARVRFDPAKYPHLVGIYGLMGVGGCGNAINGLIELYEGMIKHAGKIVPEPPANVRKAYNGQYVVKLSTNSLVETASFGSANACDALEVYIEPGKEPTQGKVFNTKKATAEAPAVCAILAAGNFEFPTDILTKMFIEGIVCVWKPNPVNESATWKYINELFAPLAKDGFFGAVNGGVDVGQAMLHHPKVTEALMTGGQASYDRIVWGGRDDAEIAAAKKAGKKNFAKPFDAELGGVGPWIVAPGTWTTAELEFQAAHLLMSKTFNFGHVCVSPQVVIVDGDWKQKQAFIDTIKAHLKKFPKMPSGYYPGSEARRQKWEADAALQGTCSRLPVSDGDYTLTLVDNVPADHPMATQCEAFAPVLTFVSISSGGDAAKFLPAAVAYANTKLYGSLCASLIVDERTLANAATAEVVEKALVDLEYGSIGFNAWGGFIALSPWVTWGAFPKHTPEDVQSGIGFINNFRVFDYPQKAILRKKWIDSAMPRMQNEYAAKLYQRVGWFNANPSVWRLMPVLSATLLGL